ncbi:MAG: CvpA family protein [Eubacteriales bacterium]|nr:CvpA family protein [Eubacteriales bacterium]
MFNMADVIVVIILGVGIGIGAIKGLAKMVVSLFSTVIAVVVAFFLQPIMLPILKNQTPLFDKLVEIISKNLDLTGITGNLVNPGAAAGELTPISPQILKILSKRIESGPVLENIQMQIVTDLAGIALQIISLVISFVVALIVFAILGFILSSADKLPVIKEVNKTAGALVGGVLSLVIIWVAMLFMNYWFSVGEKQELMLLIHQSLIAKYLYYYNFLVFYLMLLQ